MIGGTRCVSEISNCNRILTQCAKDPVKTENTSLEKNVEIFNIFTSIKKLMTKIQLDS